MRWLVLCVFLVGCGDEALYYADGSLWEPIMPLSPGGILPRDMDARAWSAFVTQSGIQADRSVKTFTPTSWDGFSVDPVGDLSYYDFGDTVFIFRSTGLSGTSNTTELSLTGVPSNIRPSATRWAFALCEDNTNTAYALVEIGADGVLTFWIFDGTPVVAAMPFNPVGWTAANSKGLVGGFSVWYVK